MSAQAITLEEWEQMHPEKRALALTAPQPTPASRFNQQSNAAIEWAQWSWNPVTGCKHDCSYCYARDIATRFYAHGFVPAIIPARLASPHVTPVPQRARHDVAAGNVFTCSMADLFGRWVPREWIEAVLRAVREAPQWRFLFLTKFPLRLAEFSWPANAWVGTTVDAQARVANAERAMAAVNAPVKWLSCEPLLERLTFTRMDLFQWVVIGGASASTRTPEFRPPREWVTHLEAQAEGAGCAIYEKENLLTRRTAMPLALPAGARALAVARAFDMPYLQRDVLPLVQEGPVTTLPRTGEVYHG